MHQRKTRITLVIGSACLALAIAGCSNKKTDQASATNANGSTSTAPSGQRASQSNMALVRFVNAVPGDSADLWFGNDKAFSNVAFKTVTPYKELPGERRDFILTPAGSTAANQKNEPSNSEGLSDGAHYTVVAALDKDGKQKLKVINDNLTPPADGKAKVRVVNASPVEIDVASPQSRTAPSDVNSADRAKNPDVPSTRETADTNKWFGGVNGDSATGYKEVDPSNTTLQVLPSGHLKGGRHLGPAAADVPMDFAAGKMYTLIVTEGKGRDGLDVIKVDDQLIGTDTTRR